MSPTRRRPDGDPLDCGPWSHDQPLKDGADVQALHGSIEPFDPTTSADSRYGGDPAPLYDAAMATWWTVGCDASDPQRLAAFWALALGYVAEPGFDGPDNAPTDDSHAVR